MAWRVEKLGPNLGAAVTGVDLAAPLDDAAFLELHAAWLGYGGLFVIRDKTTEYARFRTVCQLATKIWPSA